MISSDKLAKQTAFLKAVIAFEKPIEQLAEMDITGPCWDERPEDFYFVTLSRNDVISILERFIQHDISVNDVYEWANFFDMRFDVDYESGYKSLIADTLSSLALNHEIGVPITRDFAKAMINTLKSAKINPSDI